MDDAGPHPETGLTITGRRRILEWRDRHHVAASLAISRAWQDVRPVVEERLAAITWRSALIEPDAFIAREIDPLIADSINDAARRVIAAAHAELNALVAQQIEHEASLSATPPGPDRLADATDLIGALAPLAAGVVAGAALPGMAIVSGTALFGLVATSAISSPILVGGLLLAGTGIATGVIQTARIREQRTARLRKRVNRHVEACILSTDPAGQAPSLLSRLHLSIETAASAALERLDHAI